MAAAKVTVMGGLVCTLAVAGVAGVLVLSDAASQCNGFEALLYLRCARLRGAIASLLMDLRLLGLVFDTADGAAGNLPAGAPLDVRWDVAFNELGHELGPLLEALLLLHEMLAQAVILFVVVSSSLLS